MPCSIPAPRSEAASAIRYFEGPCGDLAADLALDEALLDEAETTDGPPALRLWEAPRPAVVLGASCRLREDVHVAACLADGVPIHRRSSGGGTVVIGPGALNLTVVLPIDTAPGLAAVDRAQEYVLGRVASALRDRGRAVEVLGSGDLALGRRKFAGSAQRRLRRHFLIHTTILYRFPLDLVPRYTALPRRQPAYREGRSHDDFLTNLDLDADDLSAAIRSAWLPGDRRPEPAAPPLGLVRKLVAEKFGDRQWIERL
jgi:lipoate-protein ligase A